MNSKIRILDDLTINQIAAGEVIENTASVIKELIENSIDAGADEIFLETSQAGRQLISIKDNGVGMSNDDALLCIERHATSKIQHSEDLFSLTTMGFRGEALAAIAAVSKLMILTKEKKDHGEASQVVVEGGKIIKVQKAARNFGTTMEVRSLFYNVPVRKKFQNSLVNDLADIHKMLVFVCLAHPLLKIKWVNDGSEQFNFLPKGNDFFYNLKERINTLCGGSLVNGLLKIDAPSKDWKIQGFIGNPEYHRPNRTGQYLIVNSRPVNCPEIAQMILNTYATRLPPRRFPIFILHLSLPSEWIDANVHPQKKEIRLLPHNEFFKPLVTSIEEAFYSQKKNLPPPLRTDSVRFSEYFAKPEPLTLSEELAPYVENVQVPLQLHVEPHLLFIWEQFLFVDGLSIKATQENSIVIFEQRILEAKLAYEKFKQGKNVLSTQILLIPQPIELSKAHYVLAAEKMSFFEKLGFQYSLLSGNTILIEGVPSQCELGDVNEFVKQMLDEFKEVFIDTMQHSEHQKRIAHFLMRSIKKRTLSLEIAKVFLKELTILENFDSPFSRPLFSILTLEDLQKKLKI